MRWAIFGVTNAASPEALERERAEEAEAWRVGGLLYNMKRKREKIAKRTLQHYQKHQDEENDNSSDGRLRRIETLVEELLVFSEDQEREIKYITKEMEEATAQRKAERSTSSDTR